MSYTIKGGKITMTTDKGDIEISMDYVVSEMKKAVKTCRPNSIYAKIVRQWIKELQLGDKEIIPKLQTKMKTLFGASEVGVRDCCKSWNELLQMIYNFRNVKTTEDKKEETKEIL